MTDAITTEIARLQRENLRFQMQNDSLKTQLEMADLLVERYRRDLDVDAAQIHRLLDRLEDANDEVDVQVELARIKTIVREVVENWS